MRNALYAIALTVLACAAGHMALAQQPVLQRGYDPGLTGANLSETTLNTSNVNPNTFGLVFNLPVDDKIYAQPLYVPQVRIPNKGTYNVLYVATMSDTLYAFNADSGGAPLWSVNFAQSVGAVPVSIAKFVFGGNGNISGNMGILSTPVIDPATNIMYLVACTLEHGTMVYRLHAVNIADGTEPHPNVVISGSYNRLTFDALHQTQRVSLTLSGNQVVFAFGAVEAEAEDESGYSGWVMAYNKQTLVQSGSFASMTTGGTLGGGVWQSGRPPVVDSAGFVYVFTGNAYGNGYDGDTNFSESAVRLDPSDGLALVDWFTPSNWAYMDVHDLDLSSAGPLLIPNTNPSLLAGGGKTGIFYVLNTSNLGEYSATDSGVVQKYTIGPSSLRGGPVYWQRSAANGGPMLYDWATSDAVKAFAFNGKTFATTPASVGTGTQVYPGGILTLSADGQQRGTGVIWATVATSGDVYDNPTDPGALYAFDAGDVATQLYNSNSNSSRDNFGNFAKFVPPLVANGKVYVATFSDKVAVYGLLNPSTTPAAATPTFSPAPGSYTGMQSVTLSDATGGAVIYYTTNGTTPTTASAQCVSGTPISVTAKEKLEAIAVASGYTTSALASGSYTISALPTAATPTFSPAPGSYTGMQPVTLSDATGGAVIYYTTNGTTPTTASAQYVPGTPIKVSASETITAIAVASGHATSAAASGTYTISAQPVAGTPTLTDSQTSASTTANITTEGAVDWVHWGDSALIRKSGVAAQLSTYSVVGSGGVSTYGDDPRGISWSDGTPTVSATADTKGVYTAGKGNGFSFTAPASTTTRVLTVHVGGYNSGGTLTASLGDGSAPNVVSTTATASGQYDANYTVTYTAGSSTKLTVKWVMSSGTGNVTLNSAALTTISAQPVAGTPTLTGSQTRATTPANITTEGALDWVHWGDSVLNRKSGVTAQLSTYSVVGSGGGNAYGNDPRGISWSDGTPTASAAVDTKGVYIAGKGNGFSFTAPASTTTRVLTVHVGGDNSGGTLTASLGDGSAPNFVTTTTAVSGQYDTNYALTYASRSTTKLTVQWIMSSGTGNVTLDAAALSE